MNDRHKILTPLILIGSLTFLLSDCSSTKESNSKIVGEWEVTDVEYDAFVGNVTIEQYLLDVGYSEQEADESLSYFHNYYHDMLNGSIEFDAEYWYWTNIGPTGYEEGEWTIKNNDSIIILDEGTQWETVINIHSLTTNRLIIEFEMEVEEELDPGYEPPAEIVRLHVRLNLSK
ncbi:lipocalin family protein [Rhodohalobacter sulfatireducens]|uniref:Lipocalin family protein n=1 Tax=Rhodohalobacter sulfatireducens TaxID=2911366 RepID=A0ABS9KE14_9BACT|nr:lipocalin family protein [Rhodohalobacter sulfatireducens]MCG2589071.1 lipocalin family protein [Rhodohalobacter sulfatireducens]